MRFLHAHLQKHSTFTLTVYSIFFLTAIGLAFFTHFMNITARMQWFDDSARDLMVAKKVVQSGHFTTYKPLANGSAGFLQNSILYYNFLVLLRTFGNTQMSVIFGFAFVGILSLLAAWEVGRQVGGKWLGLVVLFVLAINDSLAFYQISVYQRSLLPSLTFILLMLAIWVWNCPSTKRVVCFLVLFTFSMLMHYGTLSFVPAVLIVTLLSYRKNSLPLLQKVVTLGLTGVICLGIWIWTTGSTPSNILGFSEYVTGLNPIEQTSTILTRHITILEDFFGVVFSGSIFTNQLMIIWLFFFGVGGILLFRTRTSPAFRIFYLFLSTYFLEHLIFLSGGYFYIERFYTSHLQALAMLLIPLVVGESLKSLPKKLFVPGLFLLCIPFLWLEWPNLVRDTDPNQWTQEFKTSQEITEAIMKDFSRLQVVKGYQYMTMTDYTSWADPGWFLPAFLTTYEEETGNSYAVLQENENNLTYTFRKPADVVYLICDKWTAPGVERFSTYDTSVEVASQMCLTPFLEKYAKNYMDVKQPPTTEIIIPSTKNRMAVNVFRITKATNPISQ